MKCPNAIAGFCPSDAPLVEHATEWWKETYCTTCGREDRENFEIARKVKFSPTPPSPPRRKRATKGEQY